MTQPDQSKIVDLVTRKPGLLVIAFVNRTEVLSKKVCHKVSLCENLQKQSCRKIIHLSNGAVTLELFQPKVTHPFKNEDF